MTHHLRLLTNLLSFSITDAYKIDSLEPMVSRLRHPTLARMHGKRAITAPKRDPMYLMLSKRDKVKCDLELVFNRPLVL
jgi:hypothetical protein